MLSGIPSAWKLTCLIGCRKVKHEIERTLNSGLNLLKLSLKRFLLASTSVVCHYYSRRMIFTRERTSRLHPLYPWIVLCLCLCARSDSTMILVSSHFVYHSSFCSLLQNWGEHGEHASKHVYYALKNESKSDERKWTERILLYWCEWRKF